MKPFPLSSRIYLLANLVVMVIGYISLSENEPGWLFIIGAFSLVFSIPAWFLVWAMLTLIKELRLSLLASWLIYVVLLFVAALSPLWTIAAFFGGSASRGLDCITLISAAGAYGASLLQALNLNDFFKTITHEQESALD